MRILFDPEILPSSTERFPQTPILYEGLSTPPADCL